MVTATYISVDVELPKESTLVRVMSNSGGQFCATRNGRKWEITFWLADDWGSMKTLIAKNDFWTYLEKVKK